MHVKKIVVTAGLTGNISSGKTTVLKMFGKHGCTAISTDDIAHELLEKDAWIRKEISAAFGPGVIAKDSGATRKRLADVVFANDEKRNLLEEILHPEIENVISRQLSKLPPGTIAVIEVPLLFECVWDRKMDYKILVSAPFETRKKRYYSGRGKKKGDFERREKSQWPEGKKAPQSDFVIDNSKGLKNTEAQVVDIIGKIRGSIDHS